MKPSLSAILRQNILVRPEQICRIVPYGDASDLPGLFARLNTEGDAVILKELWPRLCHQGRAGTTGSVAAVPVLVEFASSAHPVDRACSLALVASIAADADGVMVSNDVRSRFEAAMRRVVALATEAMPFTEKSEDFASLLGALAAAEHCPILAREVVAFFVHELQLECPPCDAYITVATETQPWRVQCDGFPDGAIAPATSDIWLDLAKYRDLCSKYQMTDLADWIEGLRRELRCPACADTFVIADALMRA